jgi:hypothetical protein
MKRLGETLAGLQSQWVLGATVLLCFAAISAAYGFLAAVALVAAGFFLGWTEGETETWLMVSAVLWLPLAAATLGPVFEGIARRKVDEAIERARSAGTAQPG